MPATAGELRTWIEARIHDGVSLNQLLAQADAVDHWSVRQLYAEVLRDQVLEHQTIYTPIEPLISKKGIEALNAGWLRPVQIHFDCLPPTKPKMLSTGKRTGVMSDNHYPKHDIHAMDVFFQIGRSVGLDELIIDGDLFDCASLSRFTPSKEQHLRWVDERMEALTEIVKIRQNFPNIPIRFVAGNHDDRPIRWIDANAVPLQGLFSLEHYLGLDDPKLNFTFVPEGKIMLAEGNLMIKHGTSISQNSGESVKKEINKAGCSVIMGHVHRRALIEVTKAAHELTGIELGCLQILHPDYLPPEETANWQQGFAIVTELGDGQFAPELIKISNGRAFYRGKLFESRLLRTN